MLDRKALQAQVMHELHAELSHRTAVNTPSGPRSSYFMHQGDNILAEYTDKTIDAVGGWSSASAAYTQGAGTDQPFLRTEWSSAGAGTNSSSRQFYRQDGLGSVIASTDQSGTNTASQRFDAWGNSIATSGTAISQYGYTGREPDVTGLMYYRARYYSPDLGRFTQRDPIGLAGGGNMFGYVNGNPVNYIDPTGLDVLLVMADNAAGIPSGSSISLVKSIAPTSGLTCTVRIGVGLLGISASYNTVKGVTYIGVGAVVGASVTITGGGEVVTTGSGAQGSVLQAAAALGNGIVGISAKSDIGGNGSTTTVAPGLGTIGVSAGVTIGYRP